MDDFDRLTPQLLAALEYAGGTHTLADIKAEIDSGECQLWPGVRSVIVTRLVQHPRTLELWFFLAGGDLAEIERMYPTVLEWGREQGCARAAFIGRHGWAKTFLTRAAGWRASSTVFEKELHNG